MITKTYKGWISKEAYLGYLLKERNQAAKFGLPLLVQVINSEIAKMAKILKLDYYELN